MSRRRLLLIAYLVLLVASNATRLARDQHPDPGGLSIAEVALDDAPAVRIAYRDAGPIDAPTVVALHGSPAVGGFAQLTSALAGRYRVIVPHLPGFGRSTRRVPDYSIAAHARYVAALLDELDIRQAHLVGYSMGGGVALSFDQQFPGRTTSLTLVSSIGVQELEMFGHYSLNHVVHGAQLAALLGAEWLLPHFGLLDAQMLNSRYARNFFDTDQRPLRAALAAFEPPLLIVHGTSDALVPFAAAREHARIAPHARLLALEGGHGLLFRPASPVTPALTSFLADVQSGQAARRGDASAGRLALAAQPVAAHVAIKLTGLAALLALVLLAVSTLVSEDAACIVAGLLVAKGALGFWPAALACMAGIYIGDALVFAAGRHLGTPALARAPLRWFVSTRGLEVAKAWFAARGAAAIVVSRFIPGTRLPTYLAAGALGLSFLRFSGWFLLACVLWTPALVALAASAGAAIAPLFERYSAYALPAVAALVLGMMTLLRLILPLMTYRGRRLLLGRWRRLTRWEFWPRLVFYPPLVLYILWLGLRYRAPTLFTAANPAMPDGGFVGESKSAILAALRRGAPDAVAAFAVLPDVDGAARAQAVQEFMTQEATDFPVVLKPDVGERGSDVCIARNDADVRRYLEAHAQRTLVQVFAPGHEFGVFYVRMPGAARGRIFAITDKRPPAVTGDGRRTLETLILADDRAVCMGSTYLARHADRLFDVPAKGERVELVDVGTHSRGCLFVDGRWVETGAMADAIDRVSRSYPGFYFGRYDLRTPDVAAFQRGEQFRIVELNGVSSEATSIYDPANSLIAAYRTLGRQWALAFAIGAANRERGVKPTPLLRFLQTLLGTDGRQP